MTLWTASGLWQKKAITSGSEPKATVNLFLLSLTHSDSVLLATGDRLIDYPHSLVGLSGVTFGEAGTSEMTPKCSGGRYNIFALSQPETVSVSFRRQPACQWPTASHKIIYTPWRRNLANDSPVRVLVSNHGRWVKQKATHLQNHSRKSSRGVCYSVSFMKWITAQGSV